MSAELILRMYYHSILPDLRVCAREHGYALAVHGSYDQWPRDLDLIAMSWVDTPSEPHVLANSLARIADQPYAFPVDPGPNRRYRKLFHIHTEYLVCASKDGKGSGYIELSVALAGCESETESATGGGE